ncbi:hypothetical protein [Streptomyces noursei]|uniref:hypothetical protein n=1 Tax=Streptomyces noursei TaxID=1971 RepID=UPI0016796208|nr:hypothetical protein [Streptomyces noursei]MCZ1021221.1 hypothetical protein [Streptomyces noursei]GGX53017.1 hypothetical protein GCM10010341_87890 [Streptomyces noursei]
MLNDIRAELAADFVNEFGVTEMTAAMATHLFLAVTTSVQGEKAQEMEFQRALQQAVTQGESWATEMVAKMLEKRLPVYRTTYQRAIAGGQDPTTALMRSHSLPIAAARELITLFSRESADGDEQRDIPSARPVLADIHSYNGKVTVTIDPTATVARARVHTRDASGPSAKAARDASVRLVDDQLTVTVPDPEPIMASNFNFSSGTVFQNVSYVGQGVTMTGLTIDENGVRIGDMTGAVGSSPIEIDVTLPPGSGVKLRGHNLDLTVNGLLAALDSETHSGSVRAGIIGKAKIHSHSGDSTIDAIQDSIDSDTHNGTTSIGTYGGGEARLVTHSGGIHLTASRHARGKIHTRSHNGPIVLRGVRGRTDLQVTTSSHNGHISTS